ncbi:hypothetical protein GM30_05060 [Trabulsiella odontotermitis]|nr:hypothetical protein GM30_05060 [Trabulsiella odontotermitis]
MNAHQVIGEVVHQLVKENSHINFSIIQDRLVKKFIEVSTPENNLDLIRPYEEAMRMFIVDYNPKI